jgi:hypothetical protein
LSVGQWEDTVREEVVKEESVVSNTLFHVREVCLWVDFPFFVWRVGLGDQCEKVKKGHPLLKICKGIAMENFMPKRKGNSLFLL